MTINPTDDDLLEDLLDEAEELLDIKFSCNSDPDSYEIPIEEHERYVNDIEQAVEGWLSGEWDGTAFWTTYCQASDKLHNHYPEGFYSVDPVAERRAKLSYLRRVSAEEDADCVTNASMCLEEGYSSFVFDKCGRIPGADDPILSRRYLTLLAHIYWASHQDEEIRSYTPLGWRPSDHVPT